VPRGLDWHSGGQDDEDAIDCGKRVGTGSGGAAGDAASSAAETGRSGSGSHPKVAELFKHRRPNRAEFDHGSSADCHGARRRPFDEGALVPDDPSQDLQKLPAFDVEEPTVRVYKDTAVEMARLKARIDPSHLLNATFIYVHLSDGWKLVAVHLSPQK
jgi:hypothetical protein